jgi:hypothetical protein
MVLSAHALLQYLPTLQVPESHWSPRLQKQPAARWFAWLHVAVDLGGAQWPLGPEVAFELPSRREQLAINSIAQTSVHVRPRLTAASFAG